MASTPHSRRRLRAPSVNSILQWMQGNTVTQGWDVISAMTYEKLNGWFVLQYLERLSNGENPVINGTIPQAGGISIQAVNLTLSPPLISFSSSTALDSVNLTVNFLSGQVNVIQTGEAGPNVLSSQTISPVDQFALIGVVPLTSVKGEVENHHDVVIDVVNGQNFSAGLNMPSGTQTLVGQFIKTWMVKNLNGYQYKLGTLDYSNNNTNLTPAGTFQFATQIDDTNPMDTGRLLLFIPTTYNPGGGSQPALGLSNVVPQGSSTALFISSQVVFAGILKSYYEKSFSALGITVTASQANPGAAYTVSATIASFNLGQEWLTYEGDPTVFAGTSDASADQNFESVVVPAFPFKLIPYNNGLSIQGDVQWQQDLAITYVTTRAQAAWGTAPMTATVDWQGTLSVKSVKDVVSFDGTPNVTVSFDPSSFDWDEFKWAWKNLATKIATDTQTPLNALFSLPLPSINSFAVSNLLFPGKNILDFQSAYLPGDLVIFGDVTTPGVVVDPPSVILGPSKTQQFSATAPAAVTWSATSVPPGPDAGSVSSTGLYTAPTTVSQVQVVQVLATDTKTGDAAAALVTLVPQGAQVSPSFALMTSTSLPQQFSAVLAGVSNQEVNWSISPALGTLSPDGLYTPPGSVVAPQAATITAASKSNPSVQGQSLVALFPGAPADVGVTPFQLMSPLTPGQTQQFTAKVGGNTPQSVTWSILPVGTGTITANGLYTAPNTIAAPQFVLIIATSTIVNMLYGTALAAIAPGESAGPKQPKPVAEPVR